MTWFPKMFQELKFWWDFPPLLCEIYRFFDDFGQIFTSILQILLFFKPFSTFELKIFRVEIKFIQLFLRINSFLSQKNEN